MAGETLELAEVDQATAARSAPGAPPEPWWRNGVKIAVPVPWSSGLYLLNPNAQKAGRNGPTFRNVTSHMN